MNIFFHSLNDVGLTSVKAIQLKSGHGSSNLSKAIEESADVYAFLFKSMDFKPKVKGS